jgi:hypothetical protein
VSSVKYFLAFRMIVMPSFSVSICARKVLLILLLQEDEGTQHFETSAAICQITQYHISKTLIFGTTVVRTSNFAKGSSFNRTI